MCLLLLLVVVFAVQQSVPAVTGSGERTQTHRALDAGLVPGALIDAQQETVSDGRLTARTHLSSALVLWTWESGGESREKGSKIQSSFSIK